MGLCGVVGAISYFRATKKRQCVFEFYVLRSSRTSLRVATQSITLVLECHTPSRTRSRIARSYNNLISILIPSLYVKGKKAIRANGVACTLPAWRRGPRQSAQQTQCSKSLHTGGAGWLCRLSQHRLGDDRHACGWRAACAAAVAGRQRHELSRADLARGDVAAQQARAEQLARPWLGLGLELRQGLGLEG